LRPLILLAWPAVFEVYALVQLFRGDGAIAVTVVVTGGVVLVYGVIAQYVRLIVTGIINASIS
jgi:hypothetical protein